MPEYIERDMLCRVLERYRKAPKNRYQRGVKDGMELALNAVKAIHTVDVAPVVRCKNCQNRHTIECALDYAMFDPTDDSFCSYGVQMDGGDNDAVG